MRGVWRTTPHNAAEIDDAQREEWADRCARLIADGDEYAYVQSGECIIVAFADDDDGVIRIFDCVVVSQQDRAYPARDVVVKSGRSRLRKP